MGTVQQTLSKLFQKFKLGFKFLFRKLSCLKYKIFFYHFGEGSSISNNVKIICPERICIGNNVGIANNVILDGRGGLEIGDDTMIGFETVILTSMHNHDSLQVPIRKQGMSYEPIKIDKNVWIGTRVVILPGVTIGDNSIIGANAVVNKSIRSGVVAGGVPVKILKNRDNTSNKDPLTPKSLSIVR